MRSPAASTRPAATCAEPPGRQRPGSALALPERQRARALGLAGRPLGPARQGWATAADAYRAMLHGVPYRCAGWSFGTNLLLSAPGAATARRAHEPRLPGLRRSFLTPTAALADVVLPVSTAWEREGLRVGFGPTQDGEQRPAPAGRGGAAGRGALGHLDRL
jgi:anaerobic selenocysteine-containing dehydrogenase